MRPGLVHQHLPNYTSLLLYGSVPNLCCLVQTLPNRMCSKLVEGWAWEWVAVWEVGGGGVSQRLMSDT